MKKLRVAVLISGRGSNMRSLIDATKAPDYPAEIVLVVSNKKSAPGLAHAAAAGIATKAIEQRSFGKGELARDAFEQALTKELNAVNTDLVCLAGFMRLLTSDFVNRWYGRLINIHPSLLPAFKGLNAHQRMIDAGVKIAGCTVHYVSAEMDAGPIIGQAAVPAHATDTAETLAARILEQEHRLYPECLRLLAKGEVTLRANIASLHDSTIDPDPDRFLLNPSPRV